MLLILIQPENNCLCCFIAAVHVDGRKHGFHSVRQDAGFFPAAGHFLAVAHKQTRPEAHLPCQHTQGTFAHQRSTPGRHLSFMILWIFPIEHVADAKLQNGVAKKFQPLIIRQLRGGMRQRHGKQRRVLELISQRLLQSFDHLFSFPIKRARAHCKARLLFA